ncbi:MAG: hypothetical protein ABI822_01565 [Bryobacteraceae bacterium]
MTGTPNQIDLGQRIKASVALEFNRVANALQNVALRQSGQKLLDNVTAIQILEELRTTVMARQEAGYFIREWQDLSGQIREMIARDPRHKAMRTARGVI